MGANASKPDSPKRRGSSNGFGSSGQFDQTPIQVTTNVIYPSGQHSVSVSARTPSAIHNSFNNFRIGDASADLPTGPLSDISIVSARRPDEPKVHLRSSFVTLSKLEQVTETRYCNGLFTGDRIVWISDSGRARRGAVRWLGRIRGEDVAGLEFDETLFMGSGWLQGREFYKCLPNRGAWISVSALIKERDFDGKRDSEDQQLIAGLSATRITSRPNTSNLASSINSSLKEASFGASSTATSRQGNITQLKEKPVIASTSTSNLAASRTADKVSFGNAYSGASSSASAGSSTFGPIQSTATTAAAVKPSSANIQQSHSSTVPVNRVSSLHVSQNVSGSSSTQIDGKSPALSEPLGAAGPATSRKSIGTTSNVNSKKQSSSVASSEAEEFNNPPKPVKKEKKPKPPVDLAKMHEQLLNYRPASSSNANEEVFNLFDPFPGPSTSSRPAGAENTSRSSSSRPFYDNFGTESVGDVKKNSKPKSNSNQNLRWSSEDNGTNRNMTFVNSNFLHQEVYEPLSRPGPSGNSNYNRQQSRENSYAWDRLPPAEQPDIDVYVPLNPQGGLNVHRGRGGGNRNHDNRGRGRRGNNRSRGHFRGNNDFHRNNSREDDNGNNPPQQGQRNNDRQGHNEGTGEGHVTFFNPGYSESGEASLGAQNQNRTEHRQDVRNFRGHNHNQQRGRGNRGNGQHKHNRGRGNDRRGRGNPNHNQGQRPQTDSAAATVLKEDKFKKSENSGDVANSSNTDSVSETKHECPICMEDLTRPVFQCINGHCYCEPCVDKLTECPMCRVAMTQKIRCLTMDKLLAGDS